MNTMPQETKSPANPSALRIGTPWLTTRGMKEEEMELIANWMNKVMNLCAVWQGLEFSDFEEEVAKNSDIANIALEVKEMCLKFPLEF